MKFKMHELGYRLHGHVFKDHISDTGKGAGRVIFCLEVCVQCN